MSRRYRSEPIEVVTGTHGEPAGFRWRGRRYAVHAVVATWVEALPWWSIRASGQRQVWRVEAVQRSTGAAGVYDLAWTPDREHSHGGWGLERVID